MCGFTHGFSMRFLEVVPEFIHHGLCPSGALEPLEFISIAGLHRESCKFLASKDALQVLLPCCSFYCYIEFYL